MVDERTQMKFTDFFETKNGMVEPTCEQLYKWKASGIPVKFIRLDNSGENQLLKIRADSSDWKLNVQFEFTGRATPQRNHLAELGFAVIANRGRAMMHRANVPLTDRYKLFKEAFKTATLLDGLVAITIDGKEATRYEHWCGKNPDFTAHLRVWGEAGTVTIKSNMNTKVKDRGVHCMMVGYALNHAGDTYRMWDKITNRVHETRDIIWLRRMYFEKPIINQDLAIAPVIDDDYEVEKEPTIKVGEGLDENDEQEDQLPQDEDNDTGGEVAESPNTETQVVTRTGRRIKNPSRLIEEMGAFVSDYQICLTDAEVKYYEAMKELEEVQHEFGFVGAGLGGGFENTAELHVMKYDAAMKTKDAAAWKVAVDEEHDRMVNNNVWKSIDRAKIPSNSKVLTSTWAMKKKASGKFRARLNARGFEQVDGIHCD